MIVGVLKKCSNVKKLKEIHCHMIIASIRKDNHLLFKSLQLNDCNYANLLFSQIPRPNEYSYNTIIRGMATAWKDYQLALRLYLDMIRSGLRPDNFTYPFVLIAFANLRRPCSGQTTHASIFKAGLHMDSNTQHCLITMYARCGKLVCARRVFDEIVHRDLVSWNSMISGYSKMGMDREALELFREMKIAPNEMTIASVLASCGGLGDVETGRSLEAFVESKKFELTSFLGSALIDMYAKCGDLDSARRVFDGMDGDKNKVAWNAMITGYSQNGMADEAIQLFHAMRSVFTEAKPDEITMVAVLSACASIGALEVGRSLHDYWASLSHRGPPKTSDVYVGTALIDMYAKCGDVDRASQIFHLMPWKNEVTWNAMISAFAFHGLAGEALSCFAKMNLDGTVQPDERTFLGVLSACAHAGWVSQGRKWFTHMESVLKISPKIEHYSCMVDLLARSGRIDEAWALVKRMPHQPDAVMLGSLLSACRTCKNVEIGERVSRWLLQIEPWNSGNYVISSKIYAGSKRWTDSARMRGLMRDRGVVKTPGCSWIEIWNHRHHRVSRVFRSGDAICSEIQLLCDTLNADLSMHGYLPDVHLL